MLVIPFRNRLSHCRGKLTAEAHGQVGGPPEEEGKAATGGKVSVEPAHISDGLLASDVGKRTLVRVVEGLDVLDAAELTLMLLNLLGDLGGVAGLKVERTTELADTLLKDLGTGHVVEETSQEVTLLRGNLGGRGVSGDGAVTDSPDVAGTLDNEVLVHGKTAARVLLGRDAVHEVLDDGADSVAGGPDEETVGEGDLLTATIGLADLGLDSLVGDLLDHGLGHDVDLLLLEGALGVLDQLLGEAGKDVGKSLDEGDAEAVSDIGNELLDVLLEEILELASKLDTSGTTTNDNHVQKTVNLLLGLALESGSLDAVHDLLANALGITNLLEEAGVLTDTGNAEGGVLSTDTNHQHVVGDLGLDHVATDLGGIENADDLALGVDGAGLSLVELDVGLLVAQNGADGLHDGTVLDQAGRA